MELRYLLSVTDIFMRVFLELTQIGFVNFWVLMVSFQPKLLQDRATHLIRSHENRFQFVLEIVR